MRPIRALLSLSCVAALGVAAAGCGAGPQGPGWAAAKGRGVVAARSGDWEDPILFEDFDSVEHSYDHYGPVSHPFFDALEFTPVKAAKAGSTVMEILAQNRSKPRKGILQTEGVVNAGSLVRGEGDKEKLAKQVKVKFAWGNNGAQTNEPALYAEVAFVFASKRLGKRALGYAWSNVYAPGTVIASQIGAGEDAVPMRILCLRTGTGSVNKPCSEAALAEIPLTGIERNFAADVRWAWADSTKLQEPGAAPAAAPAAPPQAEPPSPSFPAPPAQFVNGADGKPLVNTDLTGVEALGFGAEIPKGVCSQAIVDDVFIQKAW